MPDIILARPAAGQQAAIPAQAQSRIVLDFAPDDATLFRQGDNLVFGFADGGSVSLTDFYKVVTKETLPEFSVDGASVPARNFLPHSTTKTSSPPLGPQPTPRAEAATRTMPTARWKAAPGAWARWTTARPLAASLPRTSGPTAVCTTTNRS